MSQVFQLQFAVRWAEIDFNAHMRNTAYLEYASHVRCCYFQQHGFSTAEFQQQRFGPVVFQDDIRYFKEVHMLEQITVRLLLAGLSPDAYRFRLCNQFIREDGQNAATLYSNGGFIDLDKRKLITPPAGVNTLLNDLSRSEDFSVLAGRKA